MWSLCCIYCRSFLIHLSACLLATFCYIPIERYICCQPSSLNPSCVVVTLNLLLLFSDTPVHLLTSGFSLTWLVPGCQCSCQFISTMLPWDNHNTFTTCLYWFCGSACLPCLSVSLIGKVRDLTPLWTTADMPRFLGEVAEYLEDTEITSPIWKVMIALSRMEPW